MRPSPSPTVPAFLQRRNNDEFVAPPLTDRERAAARRTATLTSEATERLRLSVTEYAESRRGIAAGLLSINGANGEEYFRIPAEAPLDDSAADDALGGDEVIIDVQTHYIADRPACETSRELIRTMYPMYGADWWEGLSKVAALDFVEYLRCVFFESDTAVAVLSSPPGLSDERMLFNDEMAATRLLLERFGAQDRLLNHSVVHPDVDGEIDRMPQVVDELGPAGWKIYTMGPTSTSDVGRLEGWYLDDDIGIAFLEEVRRSGLSIVCAHKGLSGIVPTGSPRDFGPAAKMFPDLSLVAYHSGFEPGDGTPTEDTYEGPYSEARADIGVNRLITSLLDSGLEPGSNVFAELGTTWFCLIKRPMEAAHVLGKLLKYVGEDNVLWGTDAIWYGPTQAAVDAFRAFQIPESMQADYGYPALTPEVKEKILGLNAARVYGINLDTARSKMGSDDVAWGRAAIDEYKKSGTPHL